MEDEFDIVYRQLSGNTMRICCLCNAHGRGGRCRGCGAGSVCGALAQKRQCDSGRADTSFLYRAVYTRALNVLKHRDIKNSYEAAMQEVYNKRALFYQPDDNDVLKRIEDRELRKHIISAIDELPENASWYLSSATCTI